MLLHSSVVKHWHFLAHRPSGICLGEGPWSKSIFFFNPVKFCLVWVIKQLKVSIFPLLPVYLLSQELTKSPLECGRSTPPSKRWAKAETRDRVLLPTARGFAYFCIWLWLEAQAPAQQNQPAQHYSVQRQLGPAGSRLAKKWRFSTVVLSQPKSSLDCKLSSSARLVMRAILFADNNIIPEGGTGSPCLPAGLSTAVRLLIFTLVAWSSWELVETSLAVGTDHTCPHAGRKYLPFLR